MSEVISNLVTPGSDIAVSFVFPSASELPDGHINMSRNTSESRVRKYRPT